MDFSRAIPTMYNGTQFRSRFEANTAFLLDGMRLSWQYEPISYMLDDGTHYRPDFWVPAQAMWVECRGYSSAKGERQIAGFAGWIRSGRVAPDGTLRDPTVCEDTDSGWVVYNDYSDEPPTPSYLVLREGVPDIYEYNEFFPDRLEAGPAVIGGCGGCGIDFFHQWPIAEFCPVCGARFKADAQYHESAMLVVRQGSLWLCEPYEHWQSLQDWVAQKIEGRRLGELARRNQQDVDRATPDTPDTPEDA